MLIPQILLICWLLFVYIIVWRSIENPRIVHFHSLLAQAIVESVETNRFSILLTWLIFTLAPLLAILTYLGIAIIFLLFVGAGIYGKFNKIPLKTKKA